MCPDAATTALPNGQSLPVATETGHLAPFPTYEAAHGGRLDWIGMFSLVGKHLLS